MVPSNNNNGGQLLFQTANHDFGDTQEDEGGSQPNEIN